MAVFSRRDMLVGAGGVAIGAKRAAPSIDLILAPSNLGLRPPEAGREPGAWRAPDVLMTAGLQARLGGAGVIALERPHYDANAQPGTRIRNGLTIRDFSLALARAVHGALGSGHFPIVIGGDCSVLLGALYGARLAGGKGLVHIDGHSDFFHPGNYDAGTALGAVAGMDLALVTGRGEALLTQWPGVEGPLVRDEDAIQIGERNALDANFDQIYGDVARTGITRLIVQEVLRMDVEAAAAVSIERLRTRALDRAWLHLDLDVLDQAIMPAVDSPGSPGLNFVQLSALIRALVQSGRFIGANVTIYDPERDPQRIYAGPIVNALGEGFAHIPTRA